MYREILMQLSQSDLFENVNRLKSTVDELIYCFEFLSEENDELNSTNAMLKRTLENIFPGKNIESQIEEINPRLQSRENIIHQNTQQKVENLKLEIVTKGQDLFIPDEESKIQSQISETISEEIPLPKARKGQSQNSNFSALEHLKFLKNKKKKQSLNS